MRRYAAFGESMVRLKPPGCERLLQSPLLEASFGGGEANVAVGLARFGMDVAYVSVIPDNPIGDACIFSFCCRTFPRGSEEGKGERCNSFL